MNTVKISSIGTYIPETRLSNSEKAVKFGYDQSFIEKKLGFVATALKSETDTTLTMCLKAFADLQQKTEFSIEDIQVVTVVTQNPTIRIPHCSAMLHNALGLKEDCMTFDISQGCSGYCHALQLINALMDSLGLNMGLVFTCDSYREIMDEEDRNVSMIFGDGATVSLISRDAAEGYELKDSVFGTAKDSNACLTIIDGKLQMKGWDVTQLAKNRIPRSIDKLLERNGIRKDEVDLFLLHQGSRHIITTLRNELEIPPEKAEFSAGDIGNTVSSSIPLLLSEYFGRNITARIILSGFGVGFSWGTCLLEYKKAESGGDR